MGVTRQAARDYLKVITYIILEKDLNFIYDYQRHL